MMLALLVFSAMQADKALPIPGEVFTVESRTAFLIPSATSAKGASKPKRWIWYAPTLPKLPGPEERWMFERFLDAGISIAGIDVGESFGSPAGRKLFGAFHAEMRKRGYSSRPMMLGRSRGGLMTLAWAVENPKLVSGFAGIYPVCNLESYPGLDKAAPAYEIRPDQLRRTLTRHNPVDRLWGLAKARVPLFAIHGDSDKIVPLEANSGLLDQRYRALGGKMQLVVPRGQGHNMWSGFFESEELVEFVRKHTRR